MTSGIHHAKEIETAVLGICLLEKDAFIRTYDLIDEETFYVDDHKKVYACLAEMYSKNFPIDMLTVWQKMVEDDYKLNEKNIPWFFAELTKNVVSSTHLEYHCHLLKNMWRKREIEKLINSGIDAFSDTTTQITDIQKQLNEILGSEQKKDWYDMSEIMYELMVHQADIKAGKKEFLKMGISVIDNLNGGFSPTDLVIIGARPAVGKSAFMGKIAMSMAKQGKKVGIISLEMNNNQIAARLASLETDIDFFSIYRNLFKDENENKRFYQIITKETINLPIFISDKTKVDVNSIKAKALKLKHTRGCDCIIVDYLQLVDSLKQNKNYNREQEVSNISRGLKLMAMEMEVPVIVLCQLNRSVTNRSGNNRHPQLSDLRESGAIEQDADIVMMLHRDFISGRTEDENGNSTEREADILGLKWRNGSPFSLKLDFDPPKMKFSERKSSGWTPIQPAINFYEKDEDS